jgi:hypothetical protein
VTRKFKNLLECANCGTPINPQTPFSQWLRALPGELSSAHVDCQNLDYVWFHYRKGWYITIEEKRFASQSAFAQQDTHGILAQQLRIASPIAINTRRGKRPIEYRGHYVIAFEATSPDDSAYVIINGSLYEDPKTVVTTLLSSGTLPGSKTELLANGFESAMVEYIRNMPRQRQVALHKWLEEILK